MNKIVIAAGVSAGLATAFVVGFECGGNYVAGRVHRRVSDAAPILSSAIVETFDKRVAGEMTTEEVKQSLKETIEFVSVVLTK